MSLRTSLAIVAVLIAGLIMPRSSALATHTPAANAPAGWYGAFSWTLDQESGPDTFNCTQRSHLVFSTSYAAVAPGTASIAGSFVQVCDRSDGVIFDVYIETTTQTFTDAVPLWEFHVQWAGGHGGLSETDPTLGGQYFLSQTVNATLHTDIDVLCHSNFPEAAPCPPGHTGLIQEDVSAASFGGCGSAPDDWTEISSAQAEPACEQQSVVSWYLTAGLPPCPNANLTDDDFDGVADLLEGPAGTGTDPCNADSDGDSFSDGDEIKAGTDPLDPTSFPGSGGGGGGGGEDGHCDNPNLEPVYCYAPEVRMHPNEDAFPIGADEFVLGSRLVWAHDGGCLDEPLTVLIDASRLGAGGGDPYGARQRTKIAGNPARSCALTGATYFADEITRPGTDAKSKPKGLAQDEGFYLDLANGQWAGEPLGLGSTVDVPVSYTYVPGSAVTYWFLYGLNPGAPGGAAADVHEGDWERITVRLSASNLATSVEYYRHECPPEVVLWETLTDADASNGDVVAGTHPIVYEALGSHASFPTIVDLGAGGIAGCPLEGRSGRLANQGAGDTTAPGGAIWRTWHDLHDASIAQWYGFGGAWGQNVALNPADGLTATGPLGPPCLDPFSTTIDIAACPPHLR